MPPYTLDQVLAKLRSSVKVAGSQSELARQLGVSPQYLSDVLRAKREPGPGLLVGIGMAQSPRTYVAWPSERTPKP